MSDIPRRVRLDRLVPVEGAIDDALRVITGFGRLPLAEHYQPTYAEQRERLQPIYRGIVAVLLLLVCSAPAWAQETPAPPPQPYTYSDGPVSLTVAMAGVVVTSAGFGLMLHTTQPCSCEPRTAWVVGGVIVVAAGVTMVWLGLRDKRVTVMPTAAPHAVGAVATIRWGAGS